MAITKPDPIIVDDEPLTECEGTDLEAVKAVRAVVDAERGYPRRCLTVCGEEPPPGVPCVVEHAFDIDAIELDDKGKPTRWATHMPEKSGLPLVALDKVNTCKLSDIRALKSLMGIVQGEDA